MTHNICKTLNFVEFRICYGMASLDTHLEDLLARGRAYFSGDAALAALDLKPAALAAAITRSIKKRRLANPKHGFYLRRYVAPADRAS